MFRHLLLPLALLGSLPGCHSHRRGLEEWPEGARPRELQSTLWLGIPEKSLWVEGNTAAMRMELGNGSAVILDDDLLLTAMHVWSSDAGPEGRPDRYQVFLGQHRDPAADRTPTPDPQLGLTLDGTDLIEAVAQLEASGYEPLSGLTQNQQFEGETLGEARDRIGQDWALLRVDDPWWSANQAATLHAPALDPEWSPDADTAIYALGFASLSEPDDPSYPSLNQLDEFVSDGPFSIAGSGLDEGSAGIMDYPDELPTPRGHSGGGIYVWNPSNQELELIGILSSCFTFRRANVLRPFGLFGIESLAVELPDYFDDQEKLVIFVPLARILSDVPEPLRAEILRAGGLEL